MRDAKKTQKMAKRARAVLQPSCLLGCINRYGWVVLVEKVSIPWRGQSNDFGHGGELIFCLRASPCNMLRNMLCNMLHGTA
jgi:hypothetical protein